MSIGGAATITQHKVVRVREVKDHTPWRDYKAVCSCGWESAPHTDRSGAERYHAEHVAEEASTT